MMENEYDGEQVYGAVKLQKGKAKDEFLGGPFVQGKSLRTWLTAGSEISEHQAKFVPFLFSTYFCGR